MMSRRIAIGIGIAIAIAIIVVFLTQHGITKITLPWIEKKPNVRYLTFRSGPLHLFTIYPNVTYVVRVLGPVFDVAGRFNKTVNWSRPVLIVVNVSGADCGNSLRTGPTISLPYTTLYINPNFTGSIEILRIPLKHGARICIWVNSRFVGCWNHTLIGIKYIASGILYPNGTDKPYCIVVFPNKTKVRIKYTEEEQEQGALIYNITLNGRLIGQLFLLLAPKQFRYRNVGVSIGPASDCITRLEIRYK